MWFHIHRAHGCPVRVRAGSINAHCNALRVGMCNSPLNFTTQTRHAMKWSVTLDLHLHELLVRTDAMDGLHQVECTTSCCACSLVNPGL